MSRYIDVELLKNKILEDMAKAEREGRDCNGYTDALFHLKTMPTADVVEVVRCKNCAYYREENGYCMNPHCSSSFYGHRVREEHYCSYGERRTEE